MTDDEWYDKELKMVKNRLNNLIDPVFMQGDTAWSVIIKSLRLIADDTDTLLRERMEKDSGS